MRNRTVAGRPICGVSICVILLVVTIVATAAIGWQPGDSPLQPSTAVKLSGNGFSARTTSSDLENTPHGAGVTVNWSMVLGSSPYTLFSGSPVTPASGHEKLTGITSETEAVHSEAATSCPPPTVTLYTPTTDGLSVSQNGITEPGSSNCTVTQINWAWGDGTTETSWFPASHTYADKGTYTITVTSVQNNSQTASASTNVTVGIYPLNQVAVSPWDDVRLSAGMSVSFTANISCGGSGSYCPAGIPSYNWSVSGGYPYTLNTTTGRTVTVTAGSSWGGNDVLQVTASLDGARANGTATIEFIAPPVRPYSIPTGILIFMVILYGLLLVGLQVWLSADRPFVRPEYLKKGGSRLLGIGFAILAPCVLLALFIPNDSGLAELSLVLAVPLFIAGILGLRAAAKLRNRLVEKGVCPECAGKGTRKVSRVAGQRPGGFVGTPHAGPIGNYEEYQGPSPIFGTATVPCRACGGSGRIG